MVKQFIKKGKDIIFAPQASVLSAATIIMTMVIASRVLGLMRQRILAHFFAPAELSLFFAAFRLPDLIFEVLVFGTFTSAFIPVFTKAFKKGESEAWDTASRVVNIGLSAFIAFALVVGIFADDIYTIVTPGYSADEVHVIANLARILFAAQGVFVVSYVLTGVLESLRRFLIPALAPLFYNLGIIVGTLLLAPHLGLMAPAVGVVIGALAHFFIQLPLAYKLGFRFKPVIKPNSEVKHIGKLAAPRIIDLSFLQIQKTIELSLASLISTAAYTYFTFANTLQLLPVGLFGISLSKAALPSLARNDEDLERFKSILMTTFNQIMFLILPFTAVLIVLRIPAVRLVYGTDIFDWEATVQTSLVLSAFAVTIPFQAAVSLLSRAFYALHDTRTPVILSLTGSFIAIIFGFVLIRIFSVPAWGLAVAYGAGVVLQASSLFILISKRINKGALLPLKSLARSLIAAVVAGGVMFFLLKLFDRSVWMKRISILYFIEPPEVPFQLFVLDTRYTLNLIVLVLLVSVMGMASYAAVAFLLGSSELSELVRFVKKRKIIGALPKEEETIAPSASDTTDS